jgi:hypothetical protein
MKEIINYLEAITENYNQMCQRRDGTRYGIEDGLNCRKGATVYGSDLEDSTPGKLDKLVLKAQGRDIRNILERKVNERKLSKPVPAYRTYFEFGIRNHKEEILEAKDLIVNVKRDKKFLDSLAKSEKITVPDAEIKARTERYKKNKKRVEEIFSKIREDVISRGDRREAKVSAKEVLDNSDVKQLPRSRKFFEDGLTDLYQISNNGVETLGQLIYTKNRAFARKAKGNEPGKINVGNKETEKEAIRSLWHEFGHHIEISNPSLKKVFKDWILSRSSGQVKTLRELTGNEKYGEDEVAYVGKFGLGIYVGRVYPDGSTEVMSKGLERFSDAGSMVSFFVKDPEHFLMILGILDSL